MQEYMRERFPEAVVLFSALGFLTLVAELLLTTHTEGIQVLAPLAAATGALAALAGLWLKAARPWAIGLLLALMGVGLLGFFQHIEESVEAHTPAQVRLVDKDGEAYPMYPRVGKGEGEETLPPPLAPLSISGLGLLGALALYVRRP